MHTEINVLGPLQVNMDGTPLVPSAAKPRQLLALLAINAGRVVTNASLIEELWGDQTPQRAPSTVHTYVLQLRRMIEQALPAGSTRTPKDVLITEHTGYSLDVDPSGLDVVRYERLAAAGRDAGADGDFAKAGELLTEALGIWRGPVLVDVHTGPQLEIEATRLSEERLSDLTLRIDADLYLGRHQQILGELAALCAQYPYLENIRAQYMLALYRSGRQSQAMETYREMWATARDQLGVRPGAQLRRLHHALLSGAPYTDDPEFLINSWVPTALAS
jgi:DNA-binding SARP family transcriptional activator